MQRKFITRSLVVIIALAFGLQFANAAETVSDLKAVNHLGKLQVTTTADDAAIWKNTQLLIDTDGNSKTGYKIDADHGFDLMIEGTTIYKFRGNDPTAWAWDKVATAKRVVDGKQLSIEFEVAAVLGDAGLTKPVALLRCLSPDYQKVLATSPVVEVGIDTTEEKVADGLSATFEQDGADFVIKATVAKPADADTLLVFFDTDSNGDTGFLPPADPHFGFEAMIQGESLSLHTGTARDGWSWKTLGPVKRTVKDSSVELRFDASLLKSKSVRVAVWQMSADWQTRTNQYPKNMQNLADVDIDTSKLHTNATRPPMPFAEPKANRDLPARERFQKITSYCCYYGADKTSDLSHFDAVILHTPAQTAVEVKRLNDLGIVTLGYISVGEDDQLHDGNGKGPGAKASWYFNKKDPTQPDKNATWNSWYANAADRLWRADRVAEAKRLCETIGFDGIFLDTIETCDTYPQSRAGMIQLVKDLREALPKKVIVINRGFSLLKESDVSSNIDGLMFESFTESYDFDSHSYIEFAPQDLDSTRAVMVNDVNPARNTFPLKVLALDYCAATQKDRIQKAFDRAATFNMVPGVTTIYLDDVFDTTAITGKADDKFLSKLATPESLSYTLDTDRNGFPAGTKVMPSSCFLGYNVAAIFDGIKDRSTLHWSKAAWASAEESGSAQQLDFFVNGTLAGGKLRITFAFDNGKWRTSQKLAVQYLSTDTWSDLPVTLSEQSAECEIPTGLHRFRIVQDAGAGSTDRPNLMWIAQVERIK